MAHRPLLAGFTGLLLVSALLSPSPAAAQVLRPEQGPIQEVRFQSTQDRALRHLLLSRGAGRHRHRGAHGRAVARAPRATARAPAARPAAAGAVRVARRLRADQRHSGRAGRRARAASPSRCGAASSCRSAVRSPTPITSSATNSCTRSSSTSPPARTMQPGQNGAERLPLWFIEGMAEYLSLGPVDPNTAMWLRDAARKEQAARRSTISTTRSTSRTAGARRSGRTSAGRWGDQVVRQMLDIGGAGRRPARRDQAGARRWTTKSCRRRVAGGDPRGLRAGPLASTMPPDRSRTAARQRQAGSAASSTSGRRISPDGRWIAFLSERSLFSIDLFIADAATGKVLHKLTSTATDPHYSSIQFIYSAGAWDAASRRIAIATVSVGHGPRWRSSMRRAATSEREMPMPELDEIFNPTWAPDGHAICFTGMSRGLTDLFVYDLTRPELRAADERRRTPICSRRGRRTARRIAFATDRFSSDLDTLAIGPYRLALIDPADRQHRAGARVHRAARTSTRSGRPTAARSISSRIATAFRTCIASTVDGGDVSADHERRHRLERHHRARARRCRSRRATGNGGVQRLRGRASTTSTRSTRDRR